ncbi:MAG TPA: 16S rRNA (uracil(1498)-N(3))-methyltransferase [Vicinamibacterales bacterium]|nr:16S rRNA (uracil(1498)-N(3))-methyltransferase [Vicinamibacterales bacterium]
MAVFPRCFAPDAGPARTITLPPDDAHHLVNVLRLGPGDAVGLFDGMGGEWVGFVQATAPDVRVDIVQAASPAPEPAVRVTLGIGLLKGAQMDAVVRDATMLGVFAIAPIVTRHVAVPRQSWRVGSAVERWQRVAVASARQCRRAVIPVVAPAMTFSDLLTSSSAGAVILCLEPGQAADLVSTDPGPVPETALVLVGPEGGWAPEEVEAAVARGARLLHLGPRTIKAEVAPIVAMSVIWSRWGW